MPNEKGVKICISDKHSGCSGMHLDVLYPVLHLRHWTQCEQTGKGERFIIVSKFYNQKGGMFLNSFYFFIIYLMRDVDMGIF